MYPEKIVCSAFPFFNWMKIGNFDPFGGNGSSIYKWFRVFVSSPISSICPLWNLNNWAVSLLSQKRYWCYWMSWRWSVSLFRLFIYKSSYFSVDLFKYYSPPKCTSIASELFLEEILVHSRMSVCQLAVVFSWLIFFHPLRICAHRVEENCVWKFSNR